MKLRSIHSSNRGFTLIEILIVMAIIAILVAIAYPIITSKLSEAKRTASFKHCKDISLGVQDFYEDYSTWPIRNAGSVTDTGTSRIRTSIQDTNDLITILFAKEKGDNAINEKKQQYITGTIVEGRIDGIYRQGDKYGYYDPWGEAYYVTLSNDVNGEGIPDPCSSRSNNTTGQNVIVWSTGPDKEGPSGTADNTKDNVFSFKVNKK